MTTEQYLSNLEAILSEPIALVKEREAQTFDQQLAERCGHVVLFGAGNLGKTALQCLRSIGVEPLAFCDSNQDRWHEVLEGVPVLSPEQAAEQYGHLALFIVTIWSKGHRYAETRAKLSRLGCERIIPTSSLRWKFADVLMPYFCQDLPHRLLQDSDRVRRAAWLWSDDKSREEYLSQVAWRVSGDCDLLSAPDREQSYFPATIFELKSDEFFVDCGSYTGDTLEQFLLRTGNKFAGIVAVEPDPRNFANLRNWTKGLNPQVRSRIQLRGVAVGSKRCQVRFAAHGSEGSSIQQDGSIVVDCVPLDELLAEASPTYIKMDIEGAESDAIVGAQKIIQEHRPVLSICVYHTQHHLWSVPILIHTLTPDYRLFLRSHDSDGWDSVCYAIPERRISASTSWTRGK
jgi:FkbM family methyltransferase